MTNRRPTIATTMLLGGLAGAALLAEPATTSRLNWVFDGAVQTSARLGDVLYVGGTFQAVAPAAQVVPPVYALSETTGALTGSAFPVADGNLAAALPDGAGGYFIAGAFTLVGESAMRAVAHVLADGTSDPAFNSTLAGTATGMARIGATLYLIGTFTQPAPVFTASAVAVSAADGSGVAWTLTLAPLAPSAIVAGDDRLVIIGNERAPMVSSGIVAAFDLAGVELWRTPVAQGGVQVPRSAWAGLRDGARVLVAHSPTAVNGGLSAVSLATGAVDPGWNPQVSPQVLALSGGVLYLGGFFSSVAGQPRMSLAAIDPATAALLPWNPGFSSPILRMAPASGGGVIVSGLFDAIGSVSTLRFRLAKIDASGAVAPWVAATRPDSVFLLVAGSPGEVVVSSSLTATGYVGRSRLAAFDLTTGDLLPWAPQADRAVAVMGAAAGRVTIGGSFTSIDGQPAAGAAALDAVTGALLPWAASAPGVATFTDPDWFYWAAGPPLNGPQVTERYSLATGAVDPAWRLPFGTDGAWAHDGDLLYLGNTLGLAAIDRRSARVRWIAPGRPVTTIAVSGDTLYTYGVLDGLATHDARSGAAIERYTTPSARAAAVVDGRLLSSESSASLGLAPPRTFVARRLDGGLSTWDPGLSHVLIGGPSTTIQTHGDVVAAGGVFGTRAPKAIVGGAAFPRNGATSPAALRARPEGPATVFTWDPPVQPPAGYVLEAGAAPGGTVATLPLGSDARVSVVVPPGTFYVRVRTAGGASEVSNEIVVRGGCQAPPPPPSGFAALIVGGARDGVSLSWTPPDAFVSSYALAAGSAPGRSDLATVPIAGGANGVTFPSGVPPGTYWLQLRASNACGTSAFTPSVRLTIGTPDDLPLAPQNLAVTTGSGATQLTWIAPPGPVTGYVLEAGSDLGLADLASVSLGAAPGFTVPAVPPGVYVLRVRAVNAAGTGPPSNDVVLRVP